MTWTLRYTKRAQKDAKKLSASKLEKKAQKLLDIVAENPYQIPPPYEKLVGDLSGAYSRRINIQHRLVYQVFESEHAVKVISLWTHYEQATHNERALIVSTSSLSLCLSWIYAVGCSVQLLYAVSTSAGKRLNAKRSFSTSTKIVSPGRNSLRSIDLASLVSTSRWMARLSGRAP